jgi:hypothetical protein
VQTEKDEMEMMKIVSSGRINPGRSGFFSYDSMIKKELPE